MSSEILETLIYAAIAVFLTYRLWSTLGERVEGEEEGIGTSQSLGIHPTDDGVGEPVAEKPDRVAPEPFNHTIDQLKGLIPDFRLDQFLDRASDAFETILKAYADGDMETLRTLLKEPLYLEFQEAIAERQGKGHTLSTTLVRIESVTLVDAALIQPHSARLTLRFVTEQTHVLKDKKGKILEGGANQSEQLTDDWTFEKDLQDPRRIWFLLETSP